MTEFNLLMTRSKARHACSEELQAGRTPTYLRKTYVVPLVGAESLDYWPPTAQSYRTAEQRQLLVLLMDEILHDFYYAGHPFQTLNLNIVVLTMPRNGTCANDRNPASSTCARNIEI